jgi:lipopolysaccharide/colanic/teichoic acid biosynthesis glycosyltransferase
MSAVENSAGEPFQALDGDANFQFFECADPVAVLSNGAVGLHDIAAELSVGADALAKRSYYVVKRCLDVAVATTLLISLCWLFVVVALVIKRSSPGAVFFRQVRIGRNGQPFTMLKFRTMRAERRRRRVDLPAGQTERRQRHKSRRDPRVTRVGRLLRRTCIDSCRNSGTYLLGR